TTCMRRAKSDGICPGAAPYPGRGRVSSGIACADARRLGRRLVVDLDIGLDRPLAVSLQHPHVPGATLRLVDGLAERGRRVERRIAARDAPEAEAAAVELGPLVEREYVCVDGHVRREVDLELERVGHAADSDRVGGDGAGPGARVPHGEGRVADLTLQPGVVTLERRQL